MTYPFSERLQLLGGMYCFKENNAKLNELLIRGVVFGSYPELVSLSFLVS